MGWTAMQDICPGPSLEFGDRCRRLERACGMSQTQLVKDVQDMAELTGLTWLERGL